MALSTITLTPQFSTNTRRKTLFIYSMSVEKKNGSLQKKKKKISKNTDVKTTQIADHFLFHSFTYGVSSIPMHPLCGTVILL